MDAHLAKEIGGEFLDGGGAADVLTVYTHKPLRIELTLYFFEGHIQRVVLAFYGANAHYTIANGDMTNVADRDNQELVGTMGNEETLPIADGLILDGFQKLSDGISCGLRFEV